MKSAPETLLVTVPVACQMLGIGETTGWKLIKTGQLKAIKIAPKATRVTMESVRRLAGAA